MLAVIAIGDLVLTIREANIPDMPGQHSLICTDTYSGTSLARTVPDEPMALEVLGSFIRIGGPGKAFTNIFDHKDFRP